MNQLTSTVAFGIIVVQGDGASFNIKCEGELALFHAGVS